MKTLFEAASMLVLLAISQFVFGPNHAAKTSVLTSVAQVSTVSTSPVDSTRPGHLVKPLSL